jgi:hypothetical protein
MVIKAKEQMVTRRGLSVMSYTVNRLSPAIVIHPEKPAFPGKNPAIDPGTIG